MPDLIKLFVALGAVTVSAVSAANETPAVALRYERGVISARAEQVPLRSVLHSLAAQSGMDIRYSDPWIADAAVSVELHAIPLGRGPPRDPVEILLPARGRGRAGHRHRAIDASQGWPELTRWACSRSGTGYSEVASERVSQ